MRGYRYTTPASLSRCAPRYFFFSIRRLADNQCTSALRTLAQAVSESAPPLSNTSPLIHQMNRLGVVGLDDREGLHRGLASSATPPPGA